MLLWIREDLTRAVKHALQRPPADPATLDALTGLPNERGLFQRLDADLKRCRRQLRTLALLLCGVDGLAEVQARFGDQARARLVGAIAAALRRTSRKEDCVARLGDEFALSLEEFPKTAFESKRNSMAALVVGVGVAQLGERPLAIRVGAAYFPGDAADAEGLLSAAAMRQSAAAPGSGPVEGGIRTNRHGAGSGLGGKHRRRRPAAVRPHNHFRSTWRSPVKCRNSGSRASNSWPS